MSKVLAIYLSKSASSVMQKIEQAQLEAGKGILGDRYYSEKGTFSQKLTGLPDKELTLIESEEIDYFNETFGFDFGYGDFRRNIITQGVRLNQLEGKTFSLGGVQLKGVRLCEPCAYLSRILTADILPAMVGRSGLRAQIVSDGMVYPDDALLI